MARISQFGGVPGASAAGSDCLPFEAMLADAMDGTLSVEDRARFDEHLRTCESCPGMLAGAQRGQALLEMLRPEIPEPSPALLDRIFAQTTVLRAREEEALRAERRAAHEAASLLGRPLPVLPQTAAAPGQVSFSTPGAAARKVLPFREGLRAQLGSLRHTVLQPRFAMTAAMAFFSIALTLNLSGIRLGEFRLSDLRPSSVKRGVYEARARVVRYYANLRVVYELESRVHDLQHADGGGGQPAQTEPAPQSKEPGSPDSDTGHAPDGKAAPAAPAQTPIPKTGEAPEDHKAPRPRSPGTSRCVWPASGFEQVGLSVSPRQTRSAVTAQLLRISSVPPGKRGLV